MSFCRLFAVGVVTGLLALDEKGIVEQRFVCIVIVCVCLYVLVARVCVHASMYCYVHTTCVLSF